MQTVFSPMGIFPSANPRGHKTATPIPFKKLKKRIKLRSLELSTALMLFGLLRREREKRDTEYSGEIEQ
jgi:hypothetical protein